VNYLDGMPPLLKVIHMSPLVKNEVTVELAILAKDCNMGKIKTHYFKSSLYWVTTQKSEDLM